MTVLLAVCAALVLEFLLLREYESARYAQERVLLERGETILNALTAGIRAHGRMGRYSGERLERIFEELAATPGVAALELRTPTGEILAAAGAADRMPPQGVDGVLWLPGFLVMSRHAQFMPGPPGFGPGGPPSEPGDGWGMHGGGHGMGMGRRGPGPGKRPPDWEDWTPFPDAPCMLTVMLDAEVVRHQITKAWRAFFIGSLVMVAGVALVTWAAVAFARQRALQAELVLSREEAAQSERLARLGAGLAHETKNPLGIVRGLAQTIGQTGDAGAETKRLAQAIVDEADRTVGRINAFLALSRPQEAALREMALAPLVKEVAALLAPEAQNKRVTVEVEAADIRVEADEELLRRAVMNLMLNALRACDAGDTVTVATEAHGGRATVTVRDTGQGIAPEDLPHVAEPYFTRFEGGTGLGLALVDQIARAHGAELRIVSTLGEGTEVSLDGLSALG